jgi:hypothetical protein
MTTDSKIWSELATAFYGRIYYQYQQNHKDLSFQPFSISVAEFCWRFGIQKYFIEVIKHWRNSSIDKQREVITQLLKRACRVNPMNMNRNFRLLRNRTIRECYQRLWLLLCRKKKFIKQIEFKNYLQQTGLGQYFRAMQKAGLKIQISSPID